MQVIDLFLWFTAYSFIGWAWETLMFTVQERRFVNRGFLNGPLCPIYGIGALILVWSFDGRTNNLYAIFIISLVMTTTLEYITGYLMEKLFNAKWWDYSMYPLNFQGRISLFSSLFFATGSVLLIRFLHPFMLRTTDTLPAFTKELTVLFLGLYLFIDISLTVRHVLLLNGRLSEIQGALNNFFGKYYRRAGEFKNAILVNFEDSEFYSDRIKTLFSLDRFQNRRILRAFPKLRSIRYDDALRRLRDKILGPRDNSDNDDNE